MKAERSGYEALIESLADGIEVDWSALEAAATTEKERRRYGNLRLVARMAELHRTLEFDELDEADGGADSIPAGAPPKSWGHLLVGERIAGGSYGDVYSARDPQLDREVALKLLRPSTRTPLDRLLQEARTLARVRHPNVVTVYGADVREGRAGLWMERVDGQTLASWVGAHGAMGAGEVAAVGADLCRALAAVHSAGLVHGDLKAHNVMRDRDGRIVLMDFGAGHAAGRGPTAGTPLYLAPEVLNSEGATPRSDIYSLGVLLFYLLTTKHPCSADDLEGLRSAHAARSRVFLRDLRPDLPAHVVDAIERSLDADPARRFATAREMEQALTAAPPRFMPSRAMTLGTVLLVAIIAIAIGLQWMERRVDSIAVMPFVEASGNSEHLMQGLTSDLLRELQRFDLEVKRGRSPRPVAAAGAGQLPSQPLGVKALLTGIATHVEGRTAVRVAVDRPEGGAVWSHEYDVAEDGVPALARQIAGDVARAIGAKLRAGAPVPSHQPNFQAYTAYLKGRAEQEKRDRPSLLRSLAFFDRAAELDADFAEPHAGKADTYMALGLPAFGGLAPLEGRRLARASALKALELNSDLVEAHTSLAFAAFVQDWDWPEAEARFKKALSINPQYALAHHWYAEFLNEMARFDEALAEIREAERLDPMSLLIKRDIAWHYFCQARYTEAVAQLGETLSTNPGYAVAQTLLARVLGQLGQYTEALAELERARPNISALSYLSFRGGIEAAAGRRAEAEATIVALRELARTEYVPPYYLAIIYTALGQVDEALTELEKGYVEQDTTMVTVNIDPRFATLRNEPRFKALIEKMRFPPKPSERAERPR